MQILVIVFAIVLLTVIIGFWWRYRTLACPASFSWLLDNPYMNAVAGADKINERIHLQKGMNVLDVGSGAGRLTLPAAKIVGKGGEVVALDIQQKMLKKLQARATSAGIQNIRLINAGAGEGRVEQNYYDRVLLVTVLGEIRNKQHALEEIFQGLKCGGILSVTEVVPDPHYITRKSVRDLCQSVGFVEQETFGNLLAFTINFSKPSEAK